MQLWLDPIKRAVRQYLLGNVHDHDSQPTEWFGLLSFLTGREDAIGA